MPISAKELEIRIEKAIGLSSGCRLCPRACGADRVNGARGFCGAGTVPKVYSYRQYMGEEPPISGTRGSGVIFFSHCTMRCVYCQNYRFSQLGEGYEANPACLSKMLLSLSDAGCHNINLVTSSHYLPGVLEALLRSRESVRHTPVVYNTSGYESEEALNLLDGIVDIYLADMRYADNGLSRDLSGSPDYVEVNRRAIDAMLRQVGSLSTDGEGIAKRGLIIRHLVMPGLLSNTEGVLRYISENLPSDTHVSLMSQYIPLYKAGGDPRIGRRLANDEHRTACGMLEKYHLEKGWVQEL
jgi:putative pyruvate formate lyase activating enzyme